jgi:hypothetical protein
VIYNMKKMYVKIINSDWSDKDHPQNIEVTSDNYGSFYVIDLVHNVRIWVFPKKDQEIEAKK